jgi:PucR C-terminal helix-turn-helix domain
VGAPGTLQDILAARSTEITDVIATAVGQPGTPESAWPVNALEQQHDLRAQAKRVLELAASGDPLTEDDLRLGREIGALFASHQIPLSLMVASFDVGITAITRQLWHIAPPEHFTEMVQFTERIAQVVKQGYQAAVRGYLEARAGSGTQTARRVVAEALISGESAAAAFATGEPLAPGYLALACAVPDPARVSAAQLDAIDQYLDSVPGALYCGDLSALVILLPAGDGRRLPEASAETSAERLPGRLRSLSGQVVYAAKSSRVDLAGIPAAAAEACSALSLVKAIPDAGCRPYRTDMLLVELAISRQPDIRDGLAALLAPLSDGPDLHRTLEALFACDLDRDRTAGELSIHRRTLRYRLDRIRELSGIDPDSAHGIQLLRAALTASRLPDGRRP